ncbi:MAG: glycosyltransferase family 2 protein [Campylobacterales bacterium]|nr:glycosyltransferase family 2 protein [Campylobacterales bacterium]MBN2832927.1 glycosyltransferase family 2 protein [Campylobacterales bacterium]
MVESQKVCIVLATYNGKSYLDEQLESIKFQTNKGFVLIAHDDGSSDGTAERLKAYDVKLIESQENLGAKQSFAELLDYAVRNTKSKYFMFCDQDDVWNQDKIEKTYMTMQMLEEKNGKNTPLLIHSNLTVVDQDLEIIAPSFWDYQHIDPSQGSLNRLLLQNVVTGCTMMINRALAEKVKYIPQEAIMHDWWMAMVASAFGKIAFIDEPLMLYRQHGKNDTGAKQYGLKYFFKKFFSKPSLEKYIFQSKAFLAYYKKELNEPDRKMLEEFSAFCQLNKCQKLRVLFKYKIWKNGLMRNLGLILFA